MSDKSTSEPMTFSVGTREVPFEIQRVPIDQLRYYEDNPRIYTLVEEKKLRGNQAGIQSELWSLSSTHQLFQDVRDNGGLLEEIIVSDGRVLEGNRRLCVYRKLLEAAGTGEDKARWSRIPARVITSPITAEEIFVLLGNLHVKGKAPWKPFEQAGFIWRMRHEFHKTDDQICDLINLAKHNVLSMLKAYELMLENGITSHEKFSYLLEYTKNPKFGTLRAKDPEVETKVISMIKEDRIPRAEAVRRLPEILSDKKAKKKFVERKADFEEALTVANVRNPEQVDTFYRTLQQTRERLRDAPIVEIVESIKEDNVKRTKIHYFFKQVDQFRKAIRWDENHGKTPPGPDSEN